MATRKTTNKQHQFSRIPSAEIQRSTFNRSCATKTTFEQGELIPIFWDEVLPGDTMNMKATIFARLSTLLFPIMDNIYMDTFFFFVPNRLLWENWERFNGAQDDPADSVSFLVPTITSPVGGYSEGTLHDYFGLPTEMADVTHISLYHRAYNLIWNTWFRDENLQDSAVVDLDDGPDTETDYRNLLHRGKRHDYFTSCLPFPQKGPSVGIPLGTTAPVTGLGLTGTAMTIESAMGESNIQHNSTLASRLVPIDGATEDVDLFWAANDQGLVADLSSATAATINALRQAFQIQRLYERDARGGTRYTEILRSHFGVTSPDARLQRPEYLGGGTTPMMIKAVEASNQSGNVDLGELGAYGVASTGNIGFKKSFVEHGVIIGMVASRADLNYQQGLNRAWSRSTRFDYYWPALAHLGEQAVLNKEIVSEGTSGAGTDETVFGYQERYAEYRYKPSMVTGRFRSNFATPLDAWHLAQDFDGPPLLNAAFIEEDPPMSRILRVPGEPAFLFDSFFDYKCVRPMPTYSVPGMIDHF